MKPLDVFLIAFGVITVPVVVAAVVYFAIICRQIAGFQIHKEGDE